MILMRFRHLLPAGLAAGALVAAIPGAALTGGAISGSALAQPAPRPGAAKPASTPVATPAPKPAAKPEAKPGAAKPAAPAAEVKPSTAKPASKPPTAGKSAPAAASPASAASTPLGSFGDWQAFAAPSGRSKICYAISQPKERLPKNVPRDPAYVFVSFNPGENIRNEVAFRMGFAAKDNAPAEAVIGSTTYVLLTKATDAWLKNLAEAGPAVSNMAKNASMMVKVQSARGSQLTDRYSLTGFGPALERARKECS
jgi:hypothetical protein